MTVAALFVDVVRGPYGKIPGVDAWGTDRDAERYDGDDPVVSHVDCGPWSRLAHLCGPALLARKRLGPIAVRQVRRNGGALEHPANSRLWEACGMPRPGEPPDKWGGRTLYVEQWRFGHRAIKPSWIYVVGALRIPPVPEPTGERPAGGNMRSVGFDTSRRSMLERLPKTQRHVTPRPFADWLVAIAASVPPGFALDPFAPDAA